MRAVERYIAMSPLRKRYVWPGGHGCGRLAILISGQLGRFLYRESDAPLIARGSSGCPSGIDVYIVLQAWGGHTYKFGSNKGASTPYAGETSEHDIESWYKKRGADRVTVRFIDP